MSRLEDILIVLSYSIRTQFTLLIGIICSGSIWLYGSFLVESMVFTGPLSAIAPILKPILLHRYEVAALVTLISFAGLALKQYLKDYQRMFGSW